MVSADSFPGSFLDPSPTPSLPHKSVLDPPKNHPGFVQPDMMHDSKNKTGCFGVLISRVSFPVNDK